MRIWNVRASAARVSTPQEVGVPDLVLPVHQNGDAPIHNAEELPAIDAVYVRSNTWMERIRHHLLKHEPSPQRGVQ